MTAPLIPLAVHAEVFRDGVIISFDDGTCAVYSMALLQAAFPQAKEIFDTDPEE